jgi:hypothetical protein
VNFAAALELSVGQSTTLDIIHQLRATKVEMEKYTG